MTAEIYAEFAESEARHESPIYERLGLAISRDDEVLSPLDTLPPAKRQPQIVLGVVRLLGGPVDDPAAFREFAVANWAAIEAEVLARSTQTNEAGRCAVLLPKPPDGAAYNLLALDGRPLAWTRSHGQAMTWLSRAAS